MMEKSSKRRKIIESLILYSGYVAIGITFSIVGPTLLDLQEITHSDTDEISIVLIARSIGSVIGAGLSGVIISRINPWITVSLSLCFCGILEVILPLCTSLVSLGFVMTSSSLFGMLYDSTGNMHLIKIWGEDHGPWMQALHCVFGVGALLGPLIATPFLSSLDQTTNGSLADNTTINNNVTEVMKEPTTNVRYAYFIAAGLMLFHSLMFFMLYLSGNRKCLIPKDDKEEEREKLGNYGKCFLISFASLVFLFNWMYCVLELTYGNYLTTYTVDELNWTKTSGAALTSVFWAFFTFGRGSGIFVVKLFQTEKMLLSMSILTVVSLIPVVFFANASNIVMWVSTIFFGLFISTIYASGLTFANMYVPVSGGIGGLFVAAGALGDLTGPIFIVPLFDTYGMQVFVVLLFVASIVMLLAFVSSWLIGKRHGKRNVSFDANSEKTRLIQPDKQPTLYE